MTCTTCGLQHVQQSSCEHNTGGEVLTAHLDLGINCRLLSVPKCTFMFLGSGFNSMTDYPYTICINNL